MSGSKAVTVTEVKSGSYESKSWEAEFYRSWNEWQIFIFQNPTSSDDFKKWQILMKRSETEPQIFLMRAYSNKTLDYKYFNNIYVPAFCNMVKNNNVIVCLRFGNFLNNAGMKYVCKLLQTNNTIELIDFENNHLDKCESIGSDLEHLIIHNKCIKTLQLHNITNEDAQGIAQGLPHNSTLTYLALYATNDSSVTNDGVQINKNGMRFLSKGLLHNHSITKINLSGNGIVDEGAKDLCSVLEVNHTIIDINLSQNGIVYLPEAFAFLTHIKKLYLHGNDNMLFPPQHVIPNFRNDNGTALFKFFADFRRFKMRFHFLLGFHKRIGINSSIQTYFGCSSICEPALINIIFEMLPCIAPIETKILNCTLK